MHDSSRADVEKLVVATAKELATAWSATPDHSTSRRVPKIRVLVSASSDTGSGRRRHGEGGVRLSSSPARCSVSRDRKVIPMPVRAWVTGLRCGAVRRLAPRRPQVAPQTNEPHNSIGPGSVKSQTGVVHLLLEIAPP